MLSPKLRQEIYGLWTMFWSSGMTNPLTAIEQITYLLFLKRLEALDKERVQQGKHSIYGPRANCELAHDPGHDASSQRITPPQMTNKDIQFCIGHATCRWTYIMDMVNSSTDPKHTHDHLSGYVFPWMRVLVATLRGNENSPANGLEATAERMEDAYFQLPREKTATLTNALQTIDHLFHHLNESDDLMGDIFEFLLSEIQTSGKNGQFRTPRHIIRFMINLLDPDKNDAVADPAAGTGGFLLNTIQYVRQKYSTPESVLLEWDGTPHRLDGRKLASVHYPASENFSGFDLDRTMVRIGWMNLLLHGLDDPHIKLQDTLGADFKDSECFDIVLANPPYSGTVDKNDVGERFHTFTTNKSDLLFLYLIIDLLKTEGKAAVIVPEGVLFGSTNAHKELRRKLVLDNTLDGVISLPAGIFQPYTGVKTSILIFTKRAQTTLARKRSQTERIWFYEINEDGYSLDAKRNPKPASNDLWDALVKWQTKDDGSTDYFQPTLSMVRWRMVGEDFYKLFPEAVALDYSVCAMDELFPELPSEPKAAESQVIDQQRPHIQKLYQDCMQAFEASLIAFPLTERKTRNQLDDAMRNLTTLFETTAKEVLETGDKLPQHGYKALQPLLKEARQLLEASETIDQRVAHILEQSTKLDRPVVPQLEAKQVKNIWGPEVRQIVHELGKIDGYNVQLRSAETHLGEPLIASKHWTRLVRTFIHTDSWLSADEQLQGSHDESGQLRPEFLADERIYNEDGSVKAVYLDPECIEANDFNLTVGRYKPFTQQTATYEAPEKLIRELQALETQIQDGLATLLAMVEENA